MLNPVPMNGGPLPNNQVLRRALQSDPEQEYFVYVPSTLGKQAPVFVPVHGIARNAEEHATVFSSYCDKLGAVLVAPLFAEEKFTDYQRLGRVGRGERADLALNEILDEVASLTEVSAFSIYLFGFSGGAQFAHRYAMAYPHRVASAVIVSAGWFTFPDPRRRYPYGIRSSTELPGVCFDLERFLLVPMAVLVGSQDATYGSMRRSKRVNRQQGKTRIERARRWVEAMRVQADTCGLESLVSFQLVRGANHWFQEFVDHSDLGNKVFEALFGLSFSRGEEAQPDGSHASR